MVLVALQGLLLGLGLLGRARGTSTGAHLLRNPKYA